MTTEKTHTLIGADGKTCQKNTQHRKQTKNKQESGFSYNISMIFLH